MNWMEQNAYGINMLDRLKELNIKPTKQNILKYLKSLPDTDSIKKAALQFKKSRRLHKMVKHYAISR